MPAQAVWAEFWPLRRQLVHAVTQMTEERRVAPVPPPFGASRVTRTGNCDAVKPASLSPRPA